MIYCYFTFADDSDALSISVEQLRRVDPAAVIYVANDAAAPATVPAGCIELRTTYDRGGTGAGLPAVRGELETFRRILTATGEDYLIKIDCDMWVRDVSLFRPGFTVAEGMPEPDFVACEGARPLSPMGCFYRISRWAVHYCLSAMADRDLLVAWPPGAYAEALTMWGLLALSRLPLHLYPAALGYLTGYTLTGAALSPAVTSSALVHCGEPFFVGSEYHRAPRVLSLTRLLHLRDLSR